MRKIRYNRIRSRTISSVGQSHRLITGWSKVRALDGPPRKKHAQACFFQRSVPLSRNVKRPADVKCASRVKCAFGTNCGTLHFTLRRPSGSPKRACRVLGNGATPQNFTVSESEPLHLRRWRKHHFSSLSSFSDAPIQSRLVPRPADFRRGVFFVIHLDSRRAVW